MSPGEEIAIGEVLSAAKSAAEEKKREGEEEKERRRVKKEEERREKEEKRRRRREEKERNPPPPSKWNRFKTGGGSFWAGLKSKAGGNGAAFFLVLAVIVHFMDFWSFPRPLPTTFRLFLYLILAFIAYAMFKDPSNVDLKSLGLFIGLSLFIWWVPQARIFVPNAWRVPFDSILLFTPGWVIYVFLNFQENRFVRWLSIGYLLFWTFFFLSWFITSRADIMGGNVIPIDPYKPMKIVGNQIREATKMIWESTVETFKSFPRNVELWWNQSMEYATGGYYRGQEEQVVEKMGIFLEDLESTAEHYYYYGEKDGKIDSDAISVWANLEAKNIGYDKEVPVKVTCGIENLDDYDIDPESIKIEVEPKDRFSMEGNDIEQIDCFIEEGLPPGYFDIQVNVTFGFTTEARVLTYWIDDERYKAITRQGKDVFEEFALEEEPESTYTSGPVAIGMGIENSLVRVGRETKPRLSVRIGRNWYEGEILEIEHIYILVPKPLELDLGDGSGRGTCTERVEYLGTQEEFNKYKVKVENEKGETIGKFKDVEESVTVSCRFKPVGENVLDPTPITLKYIKAQIDYYYQIDDSIEIEVEDMSPKFVEEGVAGEEGATKETGEGSEVMKKCAGYEDGYYYQCTLATECMKVIKGEFDDNRVCERGKYCCKTKSTEPTETEDADCASKGCCARDLGGYCLENCDTACPVEKPCPAGYCSGSATRKCCIES